MDDCSVEHDGRIDQHVGEFVRGKTIPQGVSRTTYWRTPLEANKRKFAELVGGGVQFVIPVFQRDYNWTEEQCEQLWEDIQRVGHKEEGDHFFGPVVYISTRGNSAAFTRWLLIDGQQRMTTVSLLMAALRDHFNEELSEPDNRARKIEHDFLINTFESPGQRGKLVLRERDDATLQWLVDDAEEPPESDKSVSLEGNYQFFRKKLQENVDFDTVMAGIGRLAVVDVRLEPRTDDPQQIFESLNSTGLDLTQADLIRNYILMGLEEAEQTRLYQRYWRKIEQLYIGNATQFDNFLRDFVALDQRAQRQGRENQVYAAFRLAFEEHKGNAIRLEKLLKRMARFARYHAAFVMGTGKFPKIASHLGRVRGLATTPAILIMRLLNAHERKLMTEVDLAAALDLVESYLVRRSVCRKQTRGYWQQFSKLAYALKKADVLGSLQANLHWLSDTSYAFPTNEEFCLALEENELYRFNICRTLLEGLENGKSKERTDTSGYTIEHIMPQDENLYAKWQEMLGKDWKDVHRIWLHRLGNLTLTAYNETYSNRPFDTKKSMQDGFSDSPLRLNQYVAKQDRWSSKEMEQRGKYLARRALTIWSKLEVSEKSLRRAEVNRLQAQPSDIKATRAGMDKVAREVFDEFRHRMRALNNGVIEVAKPKSVSYHNRNAAFVCEVLPRSRRVMVLFEFDVGDCVACELTVHNTDDWRFIPHARHDAGCFVEIYSVDEVEACRPLVRQALATSMD